MEFHPDEEDIVRALLKLPPIPSNTEVTARDKIESLLAKGLTPHELKVLVLIARNYAVVYNFFLEFHYVPSCSKIALNPAEILRRDPVGYLLSFLDVEVEVPAGAFRWVTPSEIESKLTTCQCGAQHALMATSVHSPASLDVWFTDVTGKCGRLKVSCTSDLKLYVRSLSSHGTSGWRWFSPHSSECCSSDEFLLRSRPPPAPAASTQPAMDAILFTGCVSVQECVWLHSALALRTQFVPGFSQLPYPTPSEEEYLEFLQWNPGLLVAAAGGAVRVSKLLVELRRLVLDRGVAMHALTDYSPRAAARLLQLLGAHDVVSAFSVEPPALKASGLTYNVITATDLSVCSSNYHNTVPIMLTLVPNNTDQLLRAVRRNSTLIFPLSPFIFLDPLPLPASGY